MGLSWRILRRLAGWALPYLLLAGVLLHGAAREHVRIEADQAQLAAFLVGIERLRSGDLAVLPELASMRAEGRVRHLDFDLQREGRELLAEAAPASARGPMRAFDAGGQTRALETGSPGSHGWQVDWMGPEGARWTLRLRPDPRAEQAEVASDATLLSLLALGLTGLLVIAVASSVRAETAPLGAMTAAIARYASGDFAARVPVMRAREFDAIGRSLNALADALAEARERARALSRRLVAAEEAQNRWLARELHDELGQWLTAARVDAAFLRTRTDGPAQEAARSLEHSLAEMGARVRGVLERLRPHGLHEDPLPAGTLEQALQELAAGWRARRGVAAAIELEVTLAARSLPNAVALATYRVVQEALSNAVRHARARRVEVRVTQAAAALDVSVEDDGDVAGTTADASAPQEDRRPPGSGRGLAGLAERVGTLGGTLDAGPVVGGWQVRATLPLPRARAAGVAADTAVADTAVADTAVADTAVPGAAAEGTAATGPVAAGSVAAGSVAAGA